MLKQILNQERPGMIMNRFYFKVGGCVVLVLLVVVGVVVFWPGRVSGPGEGEDLGAVEEQVEARREAAAKGVAQSIKEIEVGRARAEGISGDSDSECSGGMGGGVS